VTASRALAATDRDTRTRTRRPKIALAGIALAALLGGSIPVLVGVSASASGTATGIVSGIASVTSAPAQVDFAAAGQVSVKAWKLNPDGVSATNVASTVTASSGNWQFASLPIGQYDFEYDFKNSVVGAYKDAPAFQGGGVRLDDEIAGHSSGGTQFVSLPADTPSSISGVTLPLGETSAAWSTTAWHIHSPGKP
jgi:hypothetical protein